jgi:hypothetical protein
MLIELLTNVKPTIKYWLSYRWMLNQLWNVDWVIDECQNDYEMLMDLLTNVKLTMSSEMDGRIMFDELL